MEKLFASFIVWIFDTIAVNEINDFRIHYKSIELANIIGTINTNINKHIHANTHNTEEQEKLNKFASHSTIRKKNDFGVFCFTRKLVKTY